MENKNTGIGVLDTFINDRNLDDTNGDKYWTKDFELCDSVEHVKLFEKKKLEAYVKCGLELLRAKLALSHTQFLPYLLRCGMSQPTAWRRKEDAVQFLIWSNILKPTEKATQTHIIAGMELVYDKSFKMNDFQKYRFELDLDNILDSLTIAAGGSPPSRPPSPTQLLGFDWAKVMKCFWIIEKKQPELDDSVRSEVIGYLDLLKQRVHEVLEHLNEFELIRNGQGATIEK